MKKKNVLVTATRFVLVFVASLVLPSLAWYPWLAILILILFLVTGRMSKVVVTAIACVLVLINMFAIGQLVQGVWGIIAMLAYFALFSATFLNE